MAFWRKPIGFLKRDFFIASSYKFAFVFDLGTIIFSILTFFFIARLFGGYASPYLQTYGGEYFPFVLVGLALANYFSAAMTSFTRSLSQEQYTGTLEFLLLSPTRVSTILLSSCLWDFLFASVRVFLYFLLGVVFFGLDLSGINPAAALAVLALTILSFSGFGILSASFILVLKRGDPVNWFFNGISRFLGGVYFPIAILPLWMQKFSCLLPITYSLRAMRMAVLMGSSIKDILPDLTALILISIIFLPASILCFGYALKKAKLNGSLTYY